MYELLRKIPVETCWALTAKALLRLVILRGSKTLAPVLSKGDGVFAPVMGWKKYEELNNRAWAEGGRAFLPWVKETFDISVEDAIEAAKLYIVAALLTGGPEDEFEIIEASPKRVIGRWIQCGFYERYKELEIDPELTVCAPSHPLWGNEGLKAINPKLKFEFKKAMPKGDPYCEWIIEFKEE